MVTKSINLFVYLILATASRCEERSYNFPNQSFPTPSLVNTIKQLLKDTTQYVVVKIGAQIRDSPGHFYTILLGEKKILTTKFKWSSVVEGKANSDSSEDGDVQIQMAYIYIPVVRGKNQQKIIQTWKNFLYFQLSMLGYTISLFFHNVS